MATIQGVYMALFGRPADPLGLQFFNTATSNGANLTAIGDLAATAEYQGRFVGMSNSQIVTSIFQSLYNRAPDVPGLTFFTNALTSGTLNINNIAIAIYDGAQGADLTMRNLKEAAANAFTAAIDTASEINGYSGTAAAAVAVTFLAGVTVTPPTQAQIDAAVLAATTAVSTTATLTMTSQLGETITGTAANEAIIAVLNAASPNSATGTFNTGDVVNGGGGTDIMNITVTTGGALLPAGASITAVEIININQSQAAATGITSATLPGVQQLWQIDTSAAGGTFQDVSVGTGVTAGFRGNGQALGVTVSQLSGSSSTAAIDGIAAGSAITFSETAAGTLKTVNVSGSLATPGALSVSGTGGTSVNDFNVSLSSAATVSINSAAGQTQNVSYAGSTGAITSSFVGGFSGLLTVTGGTGNDILSVNNSTHNQATLTVNGGAGNDTINFVNSKSAVAGMSSLTGGSGADTFVLTGGSNLVAAASNANLLASLTTITDFNPTEDTLNISGMVGLGARVAQNVVNGAAVGADLFAVTTAVAAVTPAGQHAFFQFNGDTYLYGNIAGAGLQATDALIQLVGVTVTSLNATNLIG